MRDKTTGALLAATVLALLFAAWYVVGVGAVWMTAAGIMFGWVAATIWGLPTSRYGPGVKGASTETPSAESPRSVLYSDCESV